LTAIRQTCADLLLWLVEDSQILKTISQALSAHQGISSVAPDRTHLPEIRALTLEKPSLTTASPELQAAG